MVKVQGIVKMKYETVLVIFFIVFGFFNCQKKNENNTNYESTGTITGQDVRMCPSPCCGGWFINIDSLTYEFDSLPNNSNINLQKEIFPLVVKLDWQLIDYSGCPDKRITIQRITKE